MMIPVVKNFLAPAQVCDLRTERNSPFGILQNKFASFETYQGAILTLPLTSVVDFIQATQGTDQGNIWKTGLIKMADISVAHTPIHSRTSAKAQWDIVLQRCNIDNTPLPAPVFDPDHF